MEHLEWIKTDDIVISDINSDVSNFIELIMVNKIDLIRLIRKEYSTSLLTGTLDYFVVNIKGQIEFMPIKYLIKNNGIYYVTLISTEVMNINDINFIQEYTQFNRDHILNEIITEDHSFNGKNGK